MECRNSVAEQTPRPFRAFHGFSAPRRQQKEKRHWKQILSFASESRSSETRLTPACHSWLIALDLDSEAYFLN